MLLISLVFIYLIGSACAVPTQNIGYFAGRSGDIIVQTENAVNENSAILLHGKQFEDIKLNTMEDVSVADLLAHVMGTQPFNVATSRAGFPKGDLFNKPKAAFLFTLDSVAPELFGKYSSWKDYKNVDITTSTFPANSYTMASSLATGTKPATHGIVGESWVLPNGDKVTAHASSEGTSLAANLADIITQEWDDSLTVSASASAPFASAFAVNQRVVRHNSYGLSLAQGDFASIYKQSAKSFSLSERELSSIFKQAAFAKFLGATIKVSKEGMFITVGNNGVAFDLTKPAHFALLAELGFVYNLLETLKSGSFATLVSDSAPDFYSFVFSSIKGLKETYGENSEIVVASIKLVDSAVQSAIAQIDALYGGRTVSAVVCLDTQTVVDQEIKNIVYSSVRDSLRDEEFEMHFPSLYVRGNSDRACQQVKNSLASEAVQVHCFASAYGWTDGSRSKRADVGDAPLPPLNVPAFWIIFFFTIAIVLVILTGIYAMCAAGIDAGKDSLLFRPAGRHHHQS